MWSFAPLLTLLPTVVNGHAFIFYPPMRGGSSGNSANGYCPQCMGGGHPRPTCGTSNFLGWDQGPVTTFRPGEQVQFEVKVTAHHKGHFVVRLCDQSLGASTGGYSAEQACLNQHVLERVRPSEIHNDCVPNDPRGDCQPFDEANPGYWYLPPAGAASYDTVQEAGEDWDDINADMVVNDFVEHEALLQESSNSSLKAIARSKLGAGAEYKYHLRIPEGVSCEKCTLQFWYRTANSCTPHPDAYNCFFQGLRDQGWNADAWCSGACQYSGTCPSVQAAENTCGEQFTNCADVRISENGGNGGGGGGSSSTGGGGGGSSPTASPAASTGGCTGEPCSLTSQCRSQWGHCGSSADHCNAMSTWSSGCAGGGSSSAPEPEPEAEPTASEPEPEPEPTASTPAPTAAPRAAPRRRRAPAQSGGGVCKYQCTETYGSMSSWCSKSSRNCGWCGGQWCGSLAQTNVGEVGVHQHQAKTQRQRFLGTSGSSMMSQSEEREDIDQFLSETSGPQTEL